VLIIDGLTILSFLGVAIMLTIMPGPDNMFVLAQSIAQNRKAGLATTFGLCTGLLGHITAATVGLSAVIYQSAIAFSIVKYAGAAYLLFLAYKSFREKSFDPSLKSSGTQNYTSLYKKGVIMSLLNPKLSLFFLALLPQFVNYQHNVTVQMLVLGFIFLIESLIFLVAVSIFAEKVGHLLRKSTFISSKMNMIQGSLFALIGLKVAFSEK